MIKDFYLRSINDIVLKSIDSYGLDLEFTEFMKNCKKTN